MQGAVTAAPADRRAGRGRGAPPARPRRRRASRGRRSGSSWGNGSTDASRDAVRSPSIRRAASWAASLGFGAATTRRTQPPERTRGRVVREQSSAHGEELGIGAEVGEAVGGFEHEVGVVVAGVAGQRAEALEREHRDAHSRASGLLGEPQHAFADDVAHHLVGAARDAQPGDPASRTPTRRTSPTRRCPPRGAARASRPTSAAIRCMFAVSASFAIDISGPGSCPARIFAIARRFVYRATCWWM